MSSCREQYKCICNTAQSTHLFAETNRYVESYFGHIELKHMEKTTPLRNEGLYNYLTEHGSYKKPTIEHYECSI